MADLSVFSPTAPLRDVVINGQIKGFSPTIHPRSITLQALSWHTNGAGNDTRWVGSNGRFSFTDRTNVVREYNLIWDVGHTIVCRPGETVELTIDPGAAGKPISIFTENDFVLTGIELLAAVDLPKDYDNIYANDADKRTLEDWQTLLSDLERQRLARLEEVWPTLPHQFPELRLWAEEYIASRFREQYWFTVLQITRRNESVSNFLVHLGREIDLGLPEQAAYAMDRVGRIQNAAIYSGLRSDKFIPDEHGRYAPNAMDDDLRFQRIEALPPGLARDVMYALACSWRLQRDDTNEDDIARADAFANATPYPMLSEPIQRNLSLLRDNVTFDNRYEQRVLSLPENIDNPLPAILAAYPGKVVVMDFWSVLCSPCTFELEHVYPEFTQRYSRKDVVFVFLCRSTREPVWREYVSKLNFSAVHHLLTREQADATATLFGISGIPHRVVFGRDGGLVDGAAPRADGGLGELLNNLVEAG